MSSKSKVVERRLSGGRVSWRDLLDGDRYRPANGGKGHGNGYQPHEPSFSRDDLAEFLHASRVRELGMETEVPEMPVSPAQVLRNLDNIKGNGLVLGEGKYFFQHGKVVRRGVTDSVMPDLLAEATDMAATEETTVEDWEDNAARIRAAQFLADFLGRVGGDKAGEPIFLKAECLANYLALSLMFDRAKKEGKAIRHTAVPGSSMDHAICLSPDEIMEAISPENVLTESTFVEISAFGGAARVKYHVSVPGAIFMRLVDIKNKAGEQVEYYEGGEAGQGYDEELAEEKMKFSAADSLIHALRDLQRETERLARETGRELPWKKNGANGNGHAETAPPVQAEAPETEQVSGTASVDVGGDERPDVPVDVVEPPAAEVAVAEQMTLVADAAAVDPKGVAVGPAPTDSQAPAQAPRPKARRRLVPAGTSK